MDAATHSSDVFRPVIAAIDFGTSNSGYAFAFQDKNDEQVNAKDVYLNQWKIGSASSTTEKAPTSVLLKPDKTFDSFGYKAEDKYARLCDTETDEGWRYFKQFKMLLYNTKCLSRDSTIFDSENKPMLAIEVFSLVIGHLKKKMLEDIRIQNDQIENDDILYVLTVPAIWSDAAKQFMREAATSESVGIANDQLKLVLEPEAASVYCRQTSSCAIRDTDGSLKMIRLPVGHKYIIIDLGGGTADIASHEVIKDDMLHEIHNARGDNMGGERFNQDFLEFLSDLFGKDVFQGWKSTDRDDYLALQRAIEGIKWEISENDANDDIIIKLPSSILEHLKESGSQTLNCLVRESGHAENVQVCGKSKLSIRLHFLRSMFAEILQGLENHINDVTNEQEGIETIFLVGGLAKSQYIRQQLLTLFPNHRFIVPQDPGVAVLKGAVLLGNRPETIAGRIAVFTYGVRMNYLFIQGKHLEAYKFKRDGREFCDNIFTPIIQKGTVMAFNSKYKLQVHAYAKLPQTKLKSFHFDLFRSKTEFPTYTTDEGCALLGSLTLEPPVGGWKDEAECTVEITVGEAEFGFRVIEENGREIETKVDFILPK